jgi:hypothetical protein
MLAVKISSHYLLCLVLIAMYLGCQEKEVMTEDPNNLLLTIADKKVRYKKLVKAVQQLGPVKESPKFWSDIANSMEYTKLHRRVAIVELMRRHVRPGMKLSQLAQVLDNPIWMRNTTVKTVTWLGGYVPLTSLSPGTVFEISLFPELGGPTWSIWCIYFRVSGEIDLDDFKKVLQGQAIEQKIGDVRILEFGLATSGFGDKYFWLSGTAD